jgi:hypothetical protein
MRGQGVTEITVTLADGKAHRVRVWLGDFEIEATDLDARAADVRKNAMDFLDDVASKLSIAIERTGKVVVYRE